MEEHQELRDKVRDLISKNKTKKALEVLAKESLSALDKKLILLNGRFKKIEDDLTFGIIDDDEARQEINKINLALLDLSDEIGVAPEELSVTPKSIPTSTTVAGQSQKKNIWKILIPVLLGVVVIALLIMQPWESEGDSSSDNTSATNNNEDTQITAVGATQINPNSYYKLATAFTGDQKFLDVTPENNYHIPVLSSNSAGLWKFTPQSEGYYSITVQGLPGRSLDILNDDLDDKPVLFPSENAVGQSWKVEYEGDGFFRITNYWDVTAGKSLDVINDGNANRLQMAESTGVSGQAWKLIEQ